MAILRQLTSGLKLASLYDLGIQPTFGSSAKSKEMSEKVKEIVKKGRWVYGDTIPSEVWIIKQNYFEGPTPTDEDPTPGYPPRDGDGMFYYAGYVLKGRSQGRFNACGSSDEAVRLAESTIQSQITWDSEPQRSVTE